jgi:hypothetical protein
MQHTPFTVIVPTRERSDTLFYALQTVTRQNYEPLTILVSDNASSDDTEGIARSIGDPRIRYVNTGRRLSMAHHYEFALSHVVSGWVTILGDDDGLLPGALSEVGEAVRASRCEVIASRLCFYYWPDWRRRGGGESKLSVPLTDGCEIRDARAWLQRVISGHAYHNELPLLYTGGFASTDLIARARGGQAVFYRSMFPDIYAGIVLASIAGRFAMLRRPVAVAGVSAHSTGGSQFGHSEYRAPFSTFWGEANIACHPRLAAGPIVSRQLACYEAYLQSEHLHCNSAGVTLFDQLRLAIADATGSPEELGYVQRVAEMNEIDYEAAASAARFQRGTRHRRAERLRTATEGRRAAPDSYGAANVLEAACVCRAMVDEAAARRRPVVRRQAATDTASKPVATHASIGGSE